jgi:hypothetical protein
MQTNKETVIFLLTCLSLLGTGCSNKRDRSDYEINAQYLKESSNLMPDFRNGIVALDFLAYFKHDSLTIQVNNKEFLKTTISTDAVSGSAFLVEIDTLSRINEISIKLNSGKRAIIECNESNQLFTIEFVNHTMTIKSVTVFPPAL